jgi:hypothetical protein
LPSEALEPCEADDYLLVGGEIPPLIVEVALYSPHTLARPLACWHREAAKEIEKLEETWRDRGGVYPDETLYALGLALSVAGALRLGEKVEVEEAEAALHAASFAVKKASRVKCVAALLEMFKPLGELAPHYHVLLAYALTRYTMDSDNLEAAERLFESAAAITRELGIWESYLADLSLATRCSVLKAGSLEELKEHAKTFASLWSEAKEHEKEAQVQLLYFEMEAGALAEYLVSLALEGRVDEVSKLLDEEGWLLRRFPHVGVATRLLLERLGVRVGKPEAWEVAVALRDGIEQAFRLAFNLLMGLPEDAPDECSELKDEIDMRACLLVAAAVLGDEKAARDLKTSFLEGLSEIVEDRLKGLAQGSEERGAVERFHRELQAFVEEQGAGAVVQLFAPRFPYASFVLMLWALSSGDEELARAYAKLATINIKDKLPQKLFREAAEARGEGFEFALLKLFYYHF